MSWKLGCILIQTRWPGTEASLLRDLGLPAVYQMQRVHIVDTLELPPATTSVAVTDHCTLVFNRLLPYELSYQPPFTSILDQRLKQISYTAPVLSFFIDGISNTYGVGIFKEGICIRARKVISGRLLIDFGLPYAEEVASEQEGEDEEARLFALSAHWLGIPLDEIFFDSTFYVNNYDT